MEVISIGVVQSPVKEPMEGGWGNVISEIKVREEFAPGLKSLDSFSHVIVVFLMHKSSWEPGADLVRRPRGRSDMPEVGIFAQRAKHRPNPIGITPVEVVGLQKDTLRVRGLDAIDGTPVLDLKPYFPQFDSPPGVHVPEWVPRLMAGYF
jgi:tRNA (adenine37-N6)-methyltransferase